MKKDKSKSPFHMWMSDEKGCEFDRDTFMWKRNGFKLTAKQISEKFDEFKCVGGKRLVRLNCQICDKEFYSEPSKTCCNGGDCGCMGLPIDPIVCSDECYQKLINKEYEQVEESEAKTSK